MSCDAHLLAHSRGFLLHEDVDLIIELTKKLYRRKHVTVIDLGAGSGTTAGSVFAAREEGVHVYTYDINDEALFWAARFVGNIGHGNDASYRLMDSVEAADEWEDGTVDLILLDSSHVYEHTVRELEAWLPKLSKNGLLWCHDYTGPDSPGVSRALDEAIERGELKVLKTAGYGWAGQAA